MHGLGPEGVLGPGPGPEGGPGPGPGMPRLLLLPILLFRVLLGPVHDGAVPDTSTDLFLVQLGQVNHLCLLLLLMLQVSTFAFKVQKEY